MILARVLLTLVSVHLTATAIAEVPVIFQSGTPAKAAEVNQNFSDVDFRLNNSLGGIIVASQLASDVGVASVSCPSTGIVLSANCYCDGDGVSRNFGILFGCDVSGNGALAGCFPEGFTYNPNLPDPTAYVQARCISGLQNDGDVITPIFQLTKSSVSGAQKSEPNLDAIRTDADELEAKAADFTYRLLDYKTKLESEK